MDDRGAIRDWIWDVADAIPKLCLSASSLLIVSIWIASAFGCSEDNTHTGEEACRLSCLADQLCVGAFYAKESEAFSNSLICRRLMKVDVDLDESSEFEAWASGSREFFVANIELIGYQGTGLISVCDE